MKPEPSATAVELPKDECGELEDVNFVDHEYFDSFPPGYRFNPYDDELVEHYLARKVLGQPVPMNKIVEVNLYKYNPEELAGKMNCGENEWYFFTPRDRKYKHGKRPNRAAGDGYWKATGADKPVRKANGAKVGYKKALVFYRGKPPRGIKTNWIMHEYRVEEHPAPRPRVDNGADDMRLYSVQLDDYVLCRIYKKVGNGSLRRTPRQRELDLGGNFSPDHVDAADHDDEPQDATTITGQTVIDSMAVDNNRALHHPHYSHHLHGEEEGNLSTVATHYANQMQMEMQFGHFGGICYPSQQTFTDDDLCLSEDFWGPSHPQFGYDHHDRVVVDGHLASYRQQQQQHHGAGGTLAMTTWDSSAPGLTLDACDTKPRSTYM
ncbi:unnamed protein product [Linum tenue]|uniref:NAC domain-containing protein n=2 Tax=Linum tenue TaxID=586396 RepID=A0AAV0JTI0_9ROSI|nr:unnamed protein product [Linum tenue]